MKVKTPQILWHEKEPIYSVDFHSSNRIATAGADNDVKFNPIDVSVEYLASLKRHVKAVNVVRFSPDGEYLASGSDDGFIYLWQLNPSSKPSTLEDPDGEDKENWTNVASLGGPSKDIYDVAWAPQGKMLVAASTDSTAVVWDVLRRLPLMTLTGHVHFVQGVAWDPLGRFLVTMSADRTCRLWEAPLSPETVPNERPPPLTTLQFSPSAGPSGKREKLFAAESLPSFFRRPFWSLDGSVLWLPAGEVEEETKEKTEKQETQDKAEKAETEEKTEKEETEEKTEKETKEKTEKETKELKTEKSEKGGCVWGVTRGNLMNSSVMWRTGSSVPLVVRPHPHPHPPILGTLGNDRLPATPSELVFAVLTGNSVIVFRGGNVGAVARDLHYATLTDAAWSPDGLTLLVASADGFCSFLSFEQDKPTE